MFSQNSEKLKKFKIMPVGLRMIKTSIAVFICLIIYLLRGQQGIPFYSVIAAIFCMETDLGNSKSNAKARTFGTFNGAFWGCIVLVINTYILKDTPTLWKHLFVSISVIPVIYTAVLLKKQAVSFFSGVVFLSITVNHLSDSNPYLFVLNRVLDTLIGVAVSIIVNQISLPRRHNNNILFVSGLDETLLDDKEQITSYSKIELNRMIGRGASFTISTERTIASLMDFVKDIPIKLPVIAFNGAVLYDVNKKEFLRKKVLSKDAVYALEELLREEKVCCFNAALLQETLMIYYEEFFHPVEEEIYHKGRTSLYRNFIKGSSGSEAESLCIMCIHKQEHITKIYQRIKKLSIARNIRMVQMNSKEYPGYAYLKIYHKDATKQNMLSELKKLTGFEETVTFGTIPGRYDIVIQDSNQNMVVKKMKQIYEPFILKKKDEVNI